MSIQVLGGAELLSFGDRVCQALDECYSWHRGFGSLEAIRRRLRVGRGYLSYLTRSPNGPNAKALGRILEVLGEDERAFFHRVELLKTPERDPLHILDSLAKGRPDPEPVKRLIRAAKQLIASGPGEDLPGILANIEHAEELRRSDPTEAQRIAHSEALRARSWPVFCKAVGAYASACRGGNRLDVARRAIRLALRMTDRDGAGQLTRAKVLLKAAWVVADHSKYPEALGLVAETRAIYARESPEREAHCIVLHGVFSRYSGEFGAAAKSFRAALHLLPKGETRWRVEALLGLARVDGNTKTAQGHLDQAEALIANQPLDRAIFLIVRADLAVRWGMLHQAERLYRQGRDLLLPLNIYDSALATLLLVDVLLERGRHREAVDECVAMRELLEPFRDNEIAHAAVWSLALRAEQGRLAAELIVETREELEKARARPLRGRAQNP